MAVYLKKFSTNAEYETYINGGGVILPNVSLTVDNNTVHYNPSTPVPPTPTETRVVAKYNVTDTSSPTQLFFASSGSGSGSGGEPPFSSMEIDGIEQSEVVNEYTFNTTGEHTVKYTLIDPTSIGNSAFTYCSSLTSITIPSGVTSLGQGAFRNCTGLTSVTIPDTVTSIGEYAFFNCTSLTSIDIPSGVTSIGQNIFTNCTSLTSVTIPDSVTGIGWYAFKNCTSLTSIVIPSGVTGIGFTAFGYCSGLTSITSNAITAPPITSDTFQNVKTGGKLYVPIGSSGYDVWMGTGNYYLGLYNWTKVEQ